MVNLDYLYNPEAAKRIFSRNYFRDKKLSFNIIENGIMLPHKRITDTDDIKRRIWGAGGIVDGNGEFVKNSFVVNGIGELYTPPPNQF